MQKRNRRDVLVNAESFGAKLVDAVVESLIALFWFADASDEGGLTGQGGCDRARARRKSGKRMTHSCGR